MGITILVIVGAVFQGLTSYTFTDSSAKGETQTINEVFGASTPLALLIPGGTEDADYDTQRALADKLKALEINTQNDEKLKASDQLGWISRMNSIRHRVEEIVLDELVFD